MRYICIVIMPFDTYNKVLRWLETLIMDVGNSIFAKSKH